MYREDGAAGLAHGNRGRKPPHTVSDDDRKRILELAATKYQGYNHQHLSAVKRVSQALGHRRTNVVLRHYLR